MKQCKKCGAIKELTGFSIAPHNRDNRSNECKSCVNKRSKRNYSIPTQYEIEFEGAHGVGYRRFVKWLRVHYDMGMGDLANGRVGHYTEICKKYFEEKK